MKRVIVILALCGLVGLLILKGRGRPAKELHGAAMGCQWTLEWRGDAASPEVLRSEIAGTLEKWEQVLSQWRSGSDLSRYNRGEAPTPDLSRVMALADGVKEATGGAFDHQLLEQVHAAGFGPEGKGMDLSSIGKGFAADRVGERLRVLGVHDFVFAIAGEVVAGDGDWPVDIEKPELGGRTIAKTVTLRNRAIATSGNYRQFIPSEEGLKTHIIDPKSGQPVIRPPSSVTVIAPDCASASSWATALFVLGPDFKGYPPGFEVSWQTP